MMTSAIKRILEKSQLSNSMEKIPPFCQMLPKCHYQGTWGRKDRRKPLTIQKATTELENVTSPQQSETNKDVTGRLPSHNAFILLQILLQILDFLLWRRSTSLLPCCEHTAEAPLNHANMISFNIQYTGSCSFNGSEEKMLLVEWRENNSGDYSVSRNEMKAMKSSGWWVIRLKLLGVWQMEQCPPSVDRLHNRSEGQIQENLKAWGGTSLTSFHN